MASSISLLEASAFSPGVRLSPAARGLSLWKHHTNKRQLAEENQQDTGKIHELTLDPSMPSASLTAQLTKTTRNKKHLQWIKTKRVRLWLTLKHRKVSDLRIYIGCCHGQGRHGVQIRPPETTERNSADLTTENNITSSQRGKRVVSGHFDRHSQMGRGWAWGEGLPPAAVRRRHWLGRAATELWTRQESRLQDRKSAVRRRNGFKRNTNRPTEWNLSLSIFALTSVLAFVWKLTQEVP